MQKNISPCSGWTAAAARCFFFTGNLSVLCESADVFAVGTFLRLESMTAGNSFFPSWCTLIVLLWQQYLNIFKGSQRGRRPAEM